VSNKDPRVSDSPILFGQISNSYLHAFRMIWKQGFDGLNEFQWDKSLIFHPVSQLLGVALETSLKGLLVCRQGKAPWGHDLEKLLGKLDDSDLSNRFDDALEELPLSQAFKEANPTAEIVELERVYRQHGLHVHLLNLVYAPPFASRYPILGGHCLPDPSAFDRIIEVALNALAQEERAWKPPPTLP